MQISLFHVDAFTNHAFRGNPAAVCPLQEWLDDDLLLKVAAENNLSEAAFFVPRGEHGVKHYDLRWFTPRCEVSLCGHATLASAYVLLNLLQPGFQTVRFETRLSGTLTVTKDSHIFLDKVPVTLDDMAFKLKAMLTTADKGVVVNADSAAPEGIVVQAMLQARRAGVEHFLIAVKHE